MGKPDTVTRGELLAVLRTLRAHPIEQGLDAAIAKLTRKG
jgi:hypothetical protein